MLLRNDVRQMRVPGTGSLRTTLQPQMCMEPYCAPQTVHSLTNAMERDDVCRKYRSVGLSGLTNKHILKPVE